jgi:hypothetical protein
MTELIVAFRNFVNASKRSVNSVQGNIVTLLREPDETQTYILWADVRFLNVKLGCEYEKHRDLKD